MKFCDPRSERWWGKMKNWMGQMRGMPRGYGRRDAHDRFYVWCRAEPISRFCGLDDERGMSNTANQGEEDTPDRRWTERRAHGLGPGQTKMLFSCWAQHRVVVVFSVLPSSHSLIRRSTPGSDLKFDERKDASLSSCLSEQQVGARSSRRGGDPSSSVV